MSQQWLMEINIFTITLRLMLATIGGGIIGFERGKKNRAAGFRTHMLVCIGACLTMITNQYIVDNLGYNSDPTRMAAQVISGVGFLGVGTIIVTGTNQIKGLTTAAGLWASACMGLAIGIGFYEGAIISFLFIMGAMVVFQKIDRMFYMKKRIADLYIEVEDVKAIKGVVGYMRSNNQRIFSLERYKGKVKEGDSIGIIVNIGFPKGQTTEEIIEQIYELEGITFVEKLS